MDTDAAKKLNEFREENVRLKRLLSESKLVKEALCEVAKRILTLAAKRRTVGLDPFWWTQGQAACAV